MAVAVHFFFVNLLHTETIANDVGIPVKSVQYGYTVAGMRCLTVCSTKWSKMLCTEVYEIRGLVPMIAHARIKKRGSMPKEKTLLPRLLKVHGAI